MEILTFVHRSENRNQNDEENKKRHLGSRAEQRGEGR
jgi:hypothetical protein